MSSIHKYNTNTHTYFVSFCVRIQAKFKRRINYFCSKMWVCVYRYLFSSVYKSNWQRTERIYIYWIRSDFTLEMKEEEQLQAVQTVWTKTLRKGSERVTWGKFEAVCSGQNTMWERAWGIEGLVGSRVQCAWNVSLQSQDGRKIVSMQGWSLWVNPAEKSTVMKNRWRPFYLSNRRKLEIWVMW